MKIMYVYILQCNDGSFYTGVTNDIERRLEEHNSGHKKQSYTYMRRPLKLVYLEKFHDPLSAIGWEKKIKGWSHAKKKALIESDWDSLRQYSKSYKVKAYHRNINS